MTLDEMIQVLQDAKDGKDIEFVSRASGIEWIDCEGNPSWDFYSFDYRSVHKRIWVGTHSKHTTQLQVDNIDCLCNPIEYIELTDSVKQKLGIE